MKDIIGPLRKFGVPAAAIPDIDILKDGGVVWTDWLKASQIPGPLHNSFGVQRSGMKALFDGAGKDMKNDGGIEALDHTGRKSVGHFFDQLDQHGVFAVRNGELESWLEHLRIPGRKTDWTLAMLDRLGDDPESENYIQPEEGDVWDFIRKIVSWIKDPERSGI